MKNRMDKLRAALGQGGKQPAESGSERESPRMSDGLSVLRKIEELYGGDREAEALQLLDRVLKMPDGFEQQLRHLRELAKDPKAIHLNPDIQQTDGAVVVHLAASMGGGMLPTMIRLRSKCFASGGVELSGPMAERARDHVKLLDSLYSDVAEFAVYASQIVTLLGDPVDGMARIDRVLEKEPDNQHAAQTRDFIARRTGDRGDNVLAIVARLQDLARKTEATGGLTARDAVPWFRDCCEIARLLERQPMHIHGWCCLLMYLLNSGRFAEAAIALHALQSVDPSPNVADGILGAGATHRMMKDIAEKAPADAARPPAGTPPEERARAIIAGLQRALGTMASQFVQAYVPDLFDVVEKGTELSADDTGSLRFLLDAVRTRQASTELQFLEEAMLAFAVGEARIGVAAFASAVEFTKQRGPSQAEDAYGFLAQSLMKQLSESTEG
ncbi:MAG: hypothetical protein R3F56_01410 [Planctomycetota bacterium]